MIFKGHIVIYRVNAPRVLQTGDYMPSMPATVVIGYGKTRLPDFQYLARDPRIWTK